MLLPVASGMKSVPEIRAIPRVARPRYEEITQLAEAVCLKHLDEEYAALSREAAATLARKRPSPLLQGQARSWACGIVYAIGRVNFLFDRSEPPYLSAPDLCALFDLSAATGSAKARVIMDALGAFQMDPRWSTRRMIERNPLVWFLDMDGLIVDARDLPRDLQERLVQAGMIPYVPEAEPR